jgi:hypothetical protein
MCGKEPEKIALNSHSALFELKIRPPSQQHDSQLPKNSHLFATLAPVFNPTAVLLFFRNIQFTNAITLAVYVVLLHLAAILGHIQPPSPMADAGHVYLSLFGWAQHSAFWSAFAAMVLVYCQALIVNGLADSYRLMNERNWLPGMAYVLTASALPDFQFLSPPLVAATFVAFSIRKIFDTYKSPKSAMLVFDTTLWIAVGSLFYPKAILLAPALFISIGVMRSWNFRDQVAFVSGFIVPLFLAWLWYFWKDMGSEFRGQQLGGLFEIFKFDTALDAEMMQKGGFLVFLLLFFVLNFGAFSRNKSMHAQKCNTVLYWVLFTGTGIALMRPDWRWEAFAMMCTPAAIFLAMTYQNMSRRFAELFHILLVVYVLVLQYFHF